MTNAVQQGVVEAVAAYVTDRTGISFAGVRGERLREAVETMLAREPVGSEHVDEALFGRLCEALTVQESYFFREPHKLALVRDHVLPALAARPGRLQVWSAGCAAGEECYTLAALLIRAGFRGRYRILGTDLSEKAVSLARRARYGRWSVRGMGETDLAELFETLGDGYLVADRFREDVAFEVHNLLEPLPEPGGSFDLILCRNVLIYLTPEATHRAVAALAGALAPGGWLVLGAADPLLLGMTGLETVVTESGLAYRRPASEETAARPPAATTSAASTTSAPAAAARSRSRSHRSTEARPQQDPEAMLSAAAQSLALARPEDAERLARLAMATSTGERQGHLVLAEALAQQGRLPESLQVAERAVRLWPDDAAPRHLLAVVLLETGDAVRAAQAARQAAYVDPGHAPAHLVLARCLELLGDNLGARRCRRNGHNLMSEER